VSHPKLFRGRVFSVKAMAVKSVAVAALKSVPFGKYCRSKPFVFSFVPRCGEWSTKRCCGLSASIVEPPPSLHLSAKGIKVHHDNSQTDSFRREDVTRLQIQTLILGVLLLRFCEARRAPHHQSRNFNECAA